MSDTLGSYVSSHSKSKTLASFFRHALCWFHQTLDAPEISLTADDFSCQDNDCQKAIVAAHVFYCYFAYGSSFERAKQCAQIFQTEPELLIPLISNLKGTLNLRFEEWLFGDALQWNWAIVQLVPHDEPMALQTAYTQLVNHLTEIMEAEWLRCNHYRCGQTFRRQDWYLEDSLSSSSSESESRSSDLPWSATYEIPKPELSNGVSSIAWFTLVHCLNSPGLRDSEWVSVILPLLLFENLQRFSGKLLSKRLESIRPKINELRGFLRNTIANASRTQLRQTPLATLAAYTRTGLLILNQNRFEKERIIIRAISQKLLDKSDVSSFEELQLGLLSKFHSIIGAIAEVSYNEESIKRTIRLLTKMSLSYKLYPRLPYLGITKKQAQIALAKFSYTFAN